MPHHIDPATPEAYPDIFMPVKCQACSRCYIDLRNGRCVYGGPFDANLCIARTYTPLTARPE